MTRSRTIWEEGRTPGSRVVLLAVGVSLIASQADILVGGDVGWFFDLVFVALCVGCALLVRPRDFFAVGVLPPLLLLGLVTFLAAGRRTTIAQADDGFVQAVVSGLSHHSLALGTGYALCLGVLGLRDRLARGLIRPGGLTRASVRTGPGLRRLRESPAGFRPTSRRRSSAPRGSLPPR